MTEIKEHLHIIKVQFEPFLNLCKGTSLKSSVLICLSMHQGWMCAHIFLCGLFCLDWKHLSSSFTLDNSKENQRIPICPHLLSLRISVFQQPEPITLDRGPSVHTSQNHSINKSPPWYLSEAWDLRLPLCLVEFAWPFGATFVWLMCLRWIRSTQKPFKSQSFAFQSNAGRTM